MGYYLSNDEYVIRKHCQMLVDAGIDVLITDITNGITYRDVYLNICRIFREIRNSGEQTPQIAFIANSGSVTTVQKLYDEFYAKNLYPELWFHWKGKPLLLAPSEGLSREILDFFTIRQSWAWSHAPWFGDEPAPWFGDGKDKWPWIDYYPQQPGWHESPDKPEQISVSVASHPMFNIGRSYHDGKQPSPENVRTSEGLHFAEHWERALEVDPEFILICGWNEWIAMRMISKGEGERFAGQLIPKGGSFFVDSCTEEFSRDIEPMKDGYGDAYYYQMTDNIRRYKGARPLPKASDVKTITIDGDFSDWTDVIPEYRDTRGDAYHRNHPGWGRIKAYVNTTGRNDFVTCKVSRDGENIYFYAETDKAITDCKDNNWMLLFIDVDTDHTTGWEGFDYLVNHKVADSKTSMVKKYNGDGKWQKVGMCTYSVKEKQFELAIPRELLGLAETKQLRFNFHWADNTKKLDDINEFAVSGDSAPNRRFNYRYQSN